MRQMRMDPAWLEGCRQRPQTRQDTRRQWERLVHLARFLDEEERILFESVIDQGGRIGRLARLTRRSPTSVRRRIHDITRRLSGTEFNAMLKHPQAFSGLEQACLRDHLVRKRPLARVARDLGTTVYEVRKTLAGVRAKAQRLGKTDQFRK